MDFETVTVNWLEVTGAVLGIIGALLIASNTRYSRLGWTPFVLSSCLLTVFYLQQGHGYLVGMSLVYTAINIFGLYRWALSPAIKATS